jgi:tetratricopeptide (TPR) repeat protein
VTGALADFEKAIKLQPGNADFRKSRAMAQVAIKSNDTDGEIEALNELIAAEPNRAKNYYLRGLAYARNRDAEKAAADFKTALRKDRRMKDAQRALDRLAKDSRGWAKKPVEIAAVPQPQPEPPPTQMPPPVSAPPAENGPPETAVSDAAPTASIPQASIPQPSIQQSATPLPPRRPIDITAEPSREERTASREPASRARVPPRPVERRRPQVRYYYYRNGRQVSFTEAFR